MTKNKKNILCIFPGPTQRPDMVDFNERFKMLSNDYSGEVYSWSKNKEFLTYKMGEFVLRSYVPKNSIDKKIPKALHILKSAIKYNKKNNVDLIICYEPVFTGVIGVFLKVLFRCKLIIELNTSNMEGAIKTEFGSNFKTNAKIKLFKVLKSISLHFADGIKLLTEGQRQTLIDSYPKKRIYSFHDFVPTNYFTSPKKNMNNYILFVGYPFHLKGLDLLVKAFESIEAEYPGIELWMIGHKLSDVAKERLGSWSPRVKFIKPMFYDKLREYFLNCNFLVLPSREEGMGRVLLEAMASGKAVIGSRVGGIPDLINDGVNGYLFEKEDIQGLTECLKKLLSNRELCNQMGKEGLKIIEQKFSSEKYVEYFSEMVTEICDTTIPATT